MKFSANGCTFFPQIFKICWKQVRLLAQGLQKSDENLQILYYDVTGALKNSLFVMCLGRFLFGIGGETLCVAQNTYAYQWFAGKELNLVFGLQLSMARIVRFCLKNICMLCKKYSQNKLLCSLEIWAKQWFIFISFFVNNFI